MATNGNDNIVFSGSTQLISTVLTNAYSGQTITINETLNVNNAIYDGLGGTDTLFMSANGDFLRIKDDLGQQTIFNIEIIQASSGGDIIDLSSTDIVLGNMTINGANGNDILWANAGDDTVTGGSGNDVIDGGLGNDILRGDSNDDALYGGDGNDNLSGGIGINQLFGGNGDDVYSYTLTSFAGSRFTDTITEASGSDLNTIALASGDVLANFTFSVDGNDLIITSLVAALDGGFSTIRIVGQFNSTDSGIDTLVFADSSTFDLNAPIVFSNGGSLAYTENDAPANINSLLTLADDDSANLAGATVSITGNFVSGQDVLVFADQNGITGNYNATTGILTLSGAASIADYQAALRSVSYQNTSDTPSESIRTISFQVSDGNIANNFSNIGTSTVSVTSTNDGPAASGTNSVSTNEDTVSAAVAIGASDVDGDTLSYSVKAGFEPLKGSVSFAGGNFTYTPTANANGSDTFTIVVDDGHGGTTEQVVSVSIAAVNDGPVASGTNSVSTNEDTASAAVAIGASDVDGDTLSYSVKAGFEPLKGSVSFAGGNFTYTPTANANGSDTFTIVVDDGHGGTTEQVVSVSIAAVNDGPVASGTNSVSTNEDTASAAVAIGASDVDGDTLSYSVKAGFEPLKGSVSFAGGNFTYTPTANANGSDTFTIVVDDGHGGTTEQVVSVSIAAVNDGPVASGTNSVSTNEDTASVAVAIGASDVDGDTLSYSVKAGFEPLKGSVSFAGGNFTYTPTANANGSDTFTIVVDDGHGGTTEQVVSVSIAAVNDGPVASGTNSVSTNEDTASAAVAIGASDVDGDTLSYSVKAGFEPLKGSVSFAGGNFTYTPTANANGSDTFTIVVDDGHGGTTEQVVSVSIAAVNDGPVASGTNSVSTNEDTASAAVAIGASDVDGDTLSYSVKAGFEPLKGSVSFAGGNFTYTPTANANGSDTFTIVVDDGHGGTTEQVVSVSIAAVNDGPAASGTNSVSTNEDTASVAVAIGASDVDGDTLSYSVKAGFEPLKGSVLFAGGNFTYTPTANANGSDTFTIVVDDGHGGTTEQVVSVSIAAVNDAPTAAATKSVTTAQGVASAAVAIGASDIDGDVLSYSIKAGAAPAKGSVSFVNGNFVYTPTANLNGADTFTIVVNDGHGGTTSRWWA